MPLFSNLIKSDNPKSRRIFPTKESGRLPQGPIRAEKDIPRLQPPKSALDDRINPDNQLRRSPRHHQSSQTPQPPRYQQSNLLSQPPRDKQSDIGRYATSGQGKPPRKPTSLLSQKMSKLSLGSKVSKPSGLSTGILSEPERQRISRMLRDIAEGPGPSSTVLKKKPTGKIIQVSDEFKVSTRDNELARRFGMALDMVQQGKPKKIHTPM